MAPLPYLNRVHNLDCVAGMQAMPDQCVDLVITDPPFGIEFEAARSNYNRSEGNVLTGYSEVNGEDYLQFTRSWMTEMNRLLKREGSAFIFSGWNYLKDILIAIDELGLETVNHLIWKYQFGVVTTRRFVSSHYHILYVCKDDRKRKFHPWCRFGQEEVDEIGRKLHYRDKEDVWTINREYWINRQKTPTKLPREIIDKILAYASDPQDVVLDPFCGSGQVPVVSHLAGRRFCGFEIVPEYHQFITCRLDSGEYLPSSLDNRHSDAGESAGLS